MKEYKMYKQIFSLKLAGYLMMCGFPIKRIHHNLKARNKDVYLFEDTPELLQAMLEYRNIVDKGEDNHGDFKQDSKS